MNYWANWLIKIVARAALECVFSGFGPGHGMQILFVDHLPITQFHGLECSFRSELELFVAHNKRKLSHSQLLVANHKTIIAQVELLVKS